MGSIGVSAALLLSACGSGAKSDDAGDTTGGKKAQGESYVGFFDRKADLSGTPKDGGTLVFGTFSSALTLDPAGATDSGVGNAELSAFYDALARYDYEKAEFVPWLAESFEADADHKVWTVKLRKGVTFSDGTPLNAEAVKLHLERTKQLRPNLYTRDITAEVKDDLTVVYTLTSPWPGFGYALATNPGRIVSPAAVDKYGADVKSNPVGTGPFVLQKWTPGEETVAKRNPTYWGDKPHLDGVKFVTIKGDQARVDSLASGDLDVAFIRGADPIKALHDQKLLGFQNIFPSGEVLVINNGAKSDKVPGADVRVRKAIALALDVDLMKQDLGGGRGLWTKQILGHAAEVDATVDAVPYDPEAATKLLDEAKADGYDGKITLTCDTTPERERKMISVQAQLNAVGFDVKIDRVPSIRDTMKKYQQDGTFELACYGFSVNGIAPIAALSEMLGSGNSLGYKDPEIDGILADIRGAKDRKELSAAADALQTKVNETQPFVPQTSAAEVVSWTTKVKGMGITAFDQPMLHEVWLDR